MSNGSWDVVVGRGSSSAPVLKTWVKFEKKCLYTVVGLYSRQSKSCRPRGSLDIKNNKSRQNPGPLDFNL
jgi:hypothetical protein